MYVWLDALTNYITGVGFPDETDPNWRYWPADVHIIGKDIIRFHAVYWPAFLMSAGIPVQKRVYAHGFLFNKGEKMSKSVGNVVDPFNLADQYGVDQLRYFFLRSEEHTSELQSRLHLVCRLLLEKKKKNNPHQPHSYFPSVRA